MTRSAVKIRIDKSHHLGTDARPYRIEDGAAARLRALNAGIAQEVRAGKPPREVAVAKLRRLNVLRIWRKGAKQTKDAEARRIQMLRNLEHDMRWLQQTKIRSPKSTIKPMGVAAMAAGAQDGSYQRLAGAISQLMQKTRSGAGVAAIRAAHAARSATSAAVNAPQALGKSAAGASSAAIERVLFGENAQSIRANAPSASTAEIATEALANAVKSKRRKIAEALVGTETLEELDAKGGEYSLSDVLAHEAKRKTPDLVDAAVAQVTKQKKALGELAGEVGMEQLRKNQSELASLAGEIAIDQLESKKEQLGAITGDMLMQQLDQNKDAIADLTAQAARRKVRDATGFEAKQLAKILASTMAGYAAYQAAMARRRFKSARAREQAAAEQQRVLYEVLETNRQITNEIKKLKAERKERKPKSGS
tara:strand:- start:12024 stop:13289 length:1266 start_codon:yes stop_codon:yes gene_type:complete